MKEGRHVGLDFYDLLIEALMGLGPRARGSCRLAQPTKAEIRTIWGVRGPGSTFPCRISCSKKKSNRPLPPGYMLADSA
jgi:hypothetical protein